MIVLVAGAKVRRGVGEVRDRPIGRGRRVRDVARRDAGPVQQEVQFHENNDRGGAFGASVTMRVPVPSRALTAESPASTSAGVPRTTRACPWPYERAQTRACPQSAGCRSRPGRISPTGGKVKRATHEDGRHKGGDASTISTATRSHPRGYAKALRWNRKRSTLLVQMLLMLGLQIG
jgi:hypothetical protein